MVPFLGSTPHRSAIELEVNPLLIARSFNSYHSNDILHPTIKIPKLSNTEQEMP